MADFEMMTNLNLNGQEVINARTENVASLPTASAAMNGRRVYLTTDNCTYECRNGVWVKIATSAEVTAAQNAGKVTVEKSGDNYVDFGIYDINREANHDFVNGYERTIILDFNVDGNIWDMM